MGSNGSGRFSDYPGTGGGNPKRGGGAGGGQPPADDRCARAFSVTLQDVEHSDYYASNSSVPPVGTRLTIGQRKRLVVLDASGASVGNLPTSFNYLADCLKGGFTYAGIISAVSGGPSAKVTVDFAPV